MCSTSWTFSSLEAALLSVSTKNHDFWPGPTPEVRDSRTSRRCAHAQSQVWQIWLDPVSFYCVCKANQNLNRTGPIQRSRFLVLTKRSAASGDVNASWTTVSSCTCTVQSYNFRHKTYYLALINRAGGLYGRILTEVVSTVRTQWRLYTRPRSRFSHADRLSSVNKM